MKKEQWLAHIEACEKGGKNRHAYAKEHDLVYSQLLYWSRKLTKSASPEFVEVKIKPEVKPKPKKINSLGVLEFPSGARLITHSPELLTLLPNILNR